MSGRAPELRATLVQLRTRVDQHFEAARARSPGAFACREGCDSCCLPGLSVFEIEAAALREALAALEPALRERVRTQGHAPERERCALLVEGRCSVYAARPLICRSHGLAVVADAGVVDHCPLNYVDQEVPRASMLVLDAVNRPLAVMAQLWDGGARVELAALAREA